jgi:hypothetical protein
MSHADRLPARRAAPARRGRAEPRPHRRDADGHGHAGIQDALFAKLKSGQNAKRIRSQVVVCDYDNMSHPDVWSKFRKYLNESVIGLKICPVDPRTNKRPAHRWNP